MTAPVPDLAAIRALADEWERVADGLDSALLPQPYEASVYRIAATELRALLDAIPAPTEPTGERRCIVGKDHIGPDAANSCIYVAPEHYDEARERFQRHLDRAATEPTGEREALVNRLHDAIDGDFLVDAGGPGKDMPIDQCGAADVVRWAATALSPTPHDGTEGGGE